MFSGVRTIVLNGLFLILSTFLLRGQSLDVGILAGLSGYEGDLTSSELSSRLQTIHLSAGAFARVHFNERLAAKLTYEFLPISGNDQLSNLPRNLSFDNRINELSMILEFNILPFDAIYSYRLVTPFIFAGISWYHSNPTTEFRNQRVDLRPLGTEGQGLPDGPDFYAQNDFAIPFGGGFKIPINQSILFTVFANARPTFTDYLDDVSGVYPDFNALLEEPSRGVIAASLSDRSWEIDGNSFEDRLYQPGDQRGNPERNDWYYSINVSLSFNFDVFQKGNRGGGRNGCPTF